MPRMNLTASWILYTNNCRVLTCSVTPPIYINFIVQQSSATIVSDDEKTNMNQGKGANHWLEETRVCFTTSSTQTDAARPQEKKF